MQGGLPTWLSVLRRPAKHLLKFEQAKLVVLGVRVRQQLLEAAALRRMRG